MRALDAGAYGVICPMVNSSADCEAFVGACRYAPAGYRSWGPVRGLIYGGPDYFQHANDTVLAIAMIETVQAMANLDEIMSIKGLDAIYVGPNDLAVSLGYEPQYAPKDPEVGEAIDTILAAALRHGIVPGIHCGSADMAAEMTAKGFQLVSLMSDARLLVDAAAGAIATARGT
jgi:4-hydroxy-2-oxoheptanedioate aldolase